MKEICSKIVKAAVFCYRVKQNYLSGLYPPSTIPRTETVREEVILAKEGISLKDNSVSPCRATKRMTSYGPTIAILNKLVSVLYYTYVQL